MPKCTRFVINHILKAMIVSPVVCVAVANLVGTTMARLATLNREKSYWRPAGNSQLATDYRSLYGDQDYLGYCFLNLASVLELMACASYGTLTL